MLRRIRAITISILLIAAVVYLATPPTVLPSRDHSNDKLGFLEHRGKRYWVKDLMNPAYRAANNDSFVKLFEQDEKFAGVQDKELHKTERIFGRPRAQQNHNLPWAGRNMADIAGE
jgi:hypothetical protein